MTFVLNFQMPILDPKPAVRCPHALTHTLVRVYTYVYVHTCSHMYAYVSTPTERERERASHFHAGHRLLRFRYGSA